jgi:hypothetical protein
MQREIKFRGQRVVDGTWVYGGFYSRGNNAYIIEDDLWSENKYSIGITEVIPETVGQFIGLCDREGREIYEGAKISLPYYQTSPICKIIFKNGRFDVDKQLFFISQESKLWEEES